MKHLDHRKSHNFSDKTKKVKKKNNCYNNKSTRTCVRVISIRNLENLNETIRKHRTQQTISKGYWKIVPKDSCEVYKDRKKRKVENERSQNINKRNRASEVENDNNVDQEAVGNKKKEIKKRFKKTYSKKRNRKRRHRCSSTASCDCIIISSSCTSFTDMDSE